MDLIPLPLRPDLKVPETDDVKELKSFLEDMADDYNKVYAILRQDVNRLSVPATRPKEPDGLSPGLGMGVSQLTERFLNLSAPRFKQGLQLADGSDRGKVNVTYQYLGVGPQIIGSGANVTWTADLAVAGAGGLDTGAEAGNTWYYLYVIVGDDLGPVNDNTGNNFQPPMKRIAAKVNVLLSVSATAPTLPPGFNRFRRVGAMRNNGSSNLYRILHYPDSDYISWNEVITGATDFRVLNVTTSAVTFTDVSCAAVAPSTSRKVLFEISTIDSAAASAVMIKNKDAGNVTYAADVAEIIVAANVTGNTQITCDCDASQNIQYRTNATTNDATIYVKGYWDIV